MITGPRTALSSARIRGSTLPRAPASGTKRSAGSASAADSPAARVTSSRRVSRSGCVGGMRERLGILEAMAKPWIVDVHSHLVPTGDDGVRTIDEGLELCRQAVHHGTRVLYATPHVHAGWDSYPLTAERRALYDAAFPVMRAQCATFGLDLRRGFEIYPGAVPASADVREFGLSGSGGYLIEFPGFWTPEPDPLGLVWAEAERAERAGLQPVLGHPERCAEIAADPQRVARFCERGWLLALNAMSLDGRHGPQARETVWRLLETGFGDLVASDSHRDSRPPQLDWAYELVAGRLGAARARPLFDGSALERASDRSIAA
jgi:protein-tyrosine phosphatase